MRALTLPGFGFHPQCISSSRNEVLAREGIDTMLSMIQKDIAAIPGRNEVLAREGIDTWSYLQYYGAGSHCRNEVLAREGIDTCSTKCA